MRRSSPNPKYSMMRKLGCVLLIFSVFIIAHLSGDDAESKNVTIKKSNVNKVEMDVIVPAVITDAKEAVLTVILTNHSSFTLSVPDYNRVWELGIVIKNSTNESPLMSEEGRKLISIPPMRRNGFELKPGESHAWTVPLYEYFGLVDGKYTVSDTIDLGFVSQKQPFSATVTAAAFEVKYLDR
jgi:hypothetical protein